MSRRIRRLSGLGGYGPAPQPVPVDPRQWATSPSRLVSPGSSEGVLGAETKATQPAPVPAQQPPPAPPSGSIYAPLSPFVFPPDDAEPFDPLPYVALGAQGTTTVVVSLPVPEGRDGVIELFGNAVFGAGWTEGSADLIWQIRRDAQPERNYENIRSSLGNPSNPVKLGLRIYSGNLIEVVAINAAAPAGIIGNPIIGARLHGWFFPKAHDSAKGW